MYDYIQVSGILMFPNLQRGRRQSLLLGLHLIETGVTIRTEQIHEQNKKDIQRRTKTANKPMSY